MLQSLPRFLVVAIVILLRGSRGSGLGHHRGGIHAPDSPVGLHAGRRNQAGRSLSALWGGELSMFGSAIRNEIRPDRDLGLLVEFLPSAAGLALVREGRRMRQSIPGARIMLDR